MLDSLKELFGFGDKIAAEVSSIRADLDRKRARRVDLLTLAPCREDIEEMLVAYIDAQANAYPSMLRESLAPLAGGPMLRESDMGGAPPGGLLAIRHTSAGAYTSPQLLGMEAGVFFLFRDQIKRAIATTVKELPWTDKVGPPRKAREAELARLEKEIAALEEKLEELHAARVKIAAAFQSDHKKGK